MFFNFILSVFLYQLSWHKFYPFFLYVLFHFVEFLSTLYLLVCVCLFFNSNLLDHLISIFCLTILFVCSRFFLSWSNLCVHSIRLYLFDFLSSIFFHFIFVFINFSCVQLVKHFHVLTLSIFMYFVCSIISFQFFIFQFRILIIVSCTVHFSILIHLELSFILITDFEASNTL